MLHYNFVFSQNIHRKLLVSQISTFLASHIINAKQCSYNIKNKPCWNKKLFEISWLSQTFRETANDEMSSYFLNDWL